MVVTGCTIVQYWAHGGTLGAIVQYWVHGGTLGAIVQYWVHGGHWVYDSTVLGAR